MVFNKVVREGSRRGCGFIRDLKGVKDVWGTSVLSRGNGNKHGACPVFAGRSG